MDHIDYVINSKDRFANSASSTNFIVQLMPIMPRNVKKITLQDAAIPLKIYNVTSNNNTILFDEGGGNLTATITPGYYSMTTLMNAIQSAMTIASGALTYTANYSSSTYKVTISATGSFILRYSLSSMLQFLKYPTTGSSSSSTSFESTTSPVIYPTTLFIKIKDYNNNIVLTNNNSATFQVPVISGQDTILFIDSITLDQSTANNKFQGANQLDVRLTDYNDVDISLQCDWTFTLRFHLGV